MPLEVVSWWCYAVPKTSLFDTRGGGLVGTRLPGERLFQNPYSQSKSH
jgi:hypothetical protein